MTNYERIKAMSIEEMAKHIVNKSYCRGIGGYDLPHGYFRVPMHEAINETIKWLKEESDIK